MKDVLYFIALINLIIEKFLRDVGICIGIKY